MNEQQQAELLARWLEDRTGPPDGLDAEVVESITALKPELAPPPSLSVEDILASVTEGPLAAAPAIPLGASLGASPEEAPITGSSTRRRPFWMVVAGVGGLSSAAAAAALLVVFGVGGGLLLTGQSPQSSMEVAGSPPSATREAAPLIEAEPVGQAVAMADTGLVPGNAETKRGTRENTPRRPRAVAAAKPSAKPTAGYGSEALGADADAVAWEDDFVDDPGDAGVEDHPEADLDRRQMIPEITESLSKAEAQAGGRGEQWLLADEAMELEEEVDAKLEPDMATDAEEFDESRKDASKKRKSADTGRQRSKDKPKQSSKADNQPPASAPMEPTPEPEAARGPVPRPAPAPMPDPTPMVSAPVVSTPAETIASPSTPAPPPPPPPADPVGGSVSTDDIMSAGATQERTYRRGATQAQDARQGTEGLVDPAVDHARVLIATGKFELAVEACENALDQHREPSRARQLLFALQGDAWAALGNMNRAERAWRKAINVRNSI